MIISNMELPGLTIRYTEDGSVPNSKSKKYRESLKLTSKIQFGVFDPAARPGELISINSNK
jgi:hexosaminidase